MIHELPVIKAPVMVVKAKSVPKKKSPPMNSNIFVEVTPPEPKHV